MSHDTKRGQIRDNALKALVTSPTFRPKREKDRTKYTRKSKHKSRKGTDSFSS